MSSPRTGGQIGELIILSADDIAQSIAAAEQRLGCTLDDLAEQARTGEFESLQHRMAWVALGRWHVSAGPLPLRPAAPLPQ